MKRAKSAKPLPRLMRPVAGGTLPGRNLLAIYDREQNLVIYDRVRPDAPPPANALYFGAMPPGTAFEALRSGPLTRG